MAQARGDAADYDVSLDKESLEADDVAVGRDGTEGVRYRVGLLGNVDEHWRRAFAFIQANSTGFFRFLLDKDANRISFNCRSADSLSDVSVVVSRLSSFVSLVNRTASVGEFEE